MAINKSVRQWVLAIVLIFLLVLVVDLLLNHGHNKENISIKKGK